MKKENLIADNDCKAQQYSVFVNNKLSRDKAHTFKRTNVCIKNKQLLYDKADVFT